MISVVIPTCHRNELLARCLDQLAPCIQTLAPHQYEVIITDDGARTTAEAMVCERYPWAKWLPGPRKGPAANRNHGARRTVGDWIAFVDDDCIPSKDWLSGYLNAMRADAVFYEGLTSCLGGLPSTLYESPINLSGGNLWSCNLMVQKKAFEDMGGFDESYSFSYEDMDFRHRINKAGRTIVFAHGAVVDHPPRRRRLGVAAANQWEGRLLYDRLNGTRSREWLPMHVLKVRLVHLSRSGSLYDWIKAAGSMVVEVAAVAAKHRKWSRAATAELQRRQDLLWVPAPYRKSEQFATDNR